MLASALRQWTRVLTLISAREHCNLATMPAARTRTYRQLMCECTEIKPHDPERRMLTAWTASAAPMSCEGAQICSQKWRPSCSTRSQVMRARYPNCMVDAGVQQCPISAFQPPSTRPPAPNKKRAPARFAWCSASEHAVLCVVVQLSRTRCSPYLFVHEAIPVQIGFASSNISRISTKAIC
jgi:hypothetical protein